MPWPPSSQGRAAMTLTPDRELAYWQDGWRRAEPGAGSTSPLLEISNATVRIYKEMLGRGPTHARARFAGIDTLVVVLQDTMTVSERKLAALGEHDCLREQRLLVHRTVEDELREVVERILSRRTLALINGIDPRCDVAAEVFLLAPATDRRPSVQGLEEAQPDLADRGVRRHDVPQRLERHSPDDRRRRAVE